MERLHYLCSENKGADQLRIKPVFSFLVLSIFPDAIRDMNEKLKQELAQLEGQIHQHAAINTRNRSIYGSQGSLR